MKRWKIICEICEQLSASFGYYSPFSPYVHLIVFLMFCKCQIMRCMVKVVYLDVHVKKMVFLANIPELFTLFALFLSVH